MKKALEVGIPYMRVIQLTYSASRIWITSLLVLMGRLSCPQFALSPR